jgi:hypothetical protein
VDGTGTVQTIQQQQPKVQTIVRRDGSVEDVVFVAALVPARVCRSGCAGFTTMGSALGSAGRQATNGAEPNRTSDSRLAMTDSERG